MHNLLFIIIIMLFVVGIVWRRRRQHRILQSRLHGLHKWAGRDAVLDPLVQQWLLHLNEDESKILLELLDGYCTSLQWELDWIFMPQIEKAPALRAVLDTSISEYARAVLHSLHAEEDVRAFQVYAALDKKPTARKRRTLVRQLYTKVNDEKLTPRTKRFFGRLPGNKPSIKEQAALIRQVFDHDPEHAMEALKEVLADDIAYTMRHVRPVVPTASVTSPV